MDKNEILSQLSSIQAEAATNTEGPSLIIAGAGSGKTRVLTYRIAYMLSNGVKPYNIMALTFTNKAAGEMKERIATVAGASNVRGLWMGTFHSLFSRILRAEAEAIGFTSSFTIYDTSDARNMVKAIIKDFNLNEEIYKPKDVASRISSLKNDLITPQAYLNNAVHSARDEEAQRGRTGEIYREYMVRCKRNNAMDFDDLLLYTNLLFRDHKDILEKYREQFRYVLVDEYQDTNFSQYLIIRELCDKYKNICVVGDDAQSIYSFRGAKIENILRFTKDYPGAALFKLEQNYRSTKTIVGAANSIISRNDRQIKKVSYSENDEGELIKIIDARTDKEEALAVVGDIEVQLDKGVGVGDMAILYRTNSQSRVFEDALRAAAIPYKIYGGVSFYQRAEIKDILAYVRLVINPDDDEAMRRVINVPARGIGPTTVDKIAANAAERGQSMWQTLISSSGDALGLRTAALNKIVEFVKLINELRRMSESSSAYDVVCAAASSSGIVGSYKLKGTAEAQSALDNIEELVNSLKQACDEAEKAGEQPIGVSAWMQEVTLLTDADNEKPEEKDKVTLMTIHSAKGLEFGNIYVVGVEEGLFPSQHTAESSYSLEEERRLFYVAVTRAINRLTLSFCYNRYRWGTSVRCIPSRFLKEIDTRYIKNPSALDVNTSLSDTSDMDEDEDFAPARRFRPRAVSRTDVSETRETPMWRKRAEYNEKALYKDPYGSMLLGRNYKKVVEDGPNPFEEDLSSRIEVGSQVLHESFGKGVVCQIDRNSPNVKVVVDFGAMGKRTLMLKFAKLKLL